MSNDLDELFSRIADDPTMPHPGDIDKLITYYRTLRASKEAGIKPKKEAGPKGKIDLAALGLAKKPAVIGTTIKRRI